MNFQLEVASEDRCFSLVFHGDGIPNLGIDALFAGYNDETFVTAILRINKAKINLEGTTTQVLAALHEQLAKGIDKQ